MPLLLCQSGSCGDGKWLSCSQVLPEAPRELVEELSRRYVYLYERITGQKFQPQPLDEAVADRMRHNIQKYL